MRKTTVLLMIAVLVLGLIALSGCGGDQPAEILPEAPVSEPGGGYPAPQNIPGDSVGGYPGADEPVNSTDSPYPGPGIAPGEPQAGGDGAVMPGTLYVDSADLVLLESFPLQMMATVRGNFADGCTYYDTYVQTVEGNEINIELFALRPAEQTCTAALVPFDIQLPVDILGLS